MYDDLESLAFSLSLLGRPGAAAAAAAAEAVDVLPQIFHPVLSPSHHLKVIVFSCRSLSLLSPIHLAPPLRPQASRTPYFAESNPRSPATARTFPIPQLTPSLVFEYTCPSPSRSSQRRWEWTTRSACSRARKPSRTGRVFKQWCLPRWPRICGSGCEWNNLLVPAWRRVRSPFAGVRKLGSRRSFVRRAGGRT